MSVLIALGRRDVPYLNPTYCRTGTWWDSRYKSSLIQADTDRLSGQRSIELNPGRAAWVDDPAHDRGTRYRHNALGQAHPYRLPHPLYLALGKDGKTRQASYRSRFRAEWDTEALLDIGLALNQIPPLGYSRCYAKVEAMTGPRAGAETAQKVQKAARRIASA